MTFLSFVTFTFWNYEVLKLLHLETITFSDATLSDINVVLCYVLSQYPTHVLTVCSSLGKKCSCCVNLLVLPNCADAKLR